MYQSSLGYADRDPTAGAFAPGTLTSRVSPGANGGIVAIVTFERESETSTASAWPTLAMNALTVIGCDGSTVDGCALGAYSSTGTTAVPLQCAKVSPYPRLNWSSQ